MNVMTPKPYELYEAHVRLNAANYSRPCLVVSLEFKGGVSILPISSAMNLYSGPSSHFLIERRDPDFNKTGLVVDSYIVGEKIFELAVFKLIRKRGQLEGELLQRFKHWFE